MRDYFPEATVEPTLVLLNVELLFRPPAADALTMADVIQAMISESQSC